MAHKKFDVAQQFATGTGTGALTPGVVTSAMYRTFAAAGMVEADTCYVRVQNASVAAEWQVCLMTLTGGTFVFTFDDFSSSATGSQISFSAGTKIVSGTIAAGAALMIDPSGTIDILDAGIIRANGTNFAIIGDTDIPVAISSQGTANIELYTGDGLRATFTDDGLALTGVMNITQAAGTGRAISTGQTASGTAVGPYALNLFTISSDTIDGTNSGPALDHFIDGWQFNRSFGGSSVRGGRQGLVSVQTLTSATNSANDNRSYPAASFQGIAESDDGGTGLTLATAKGAIYGAHSVGWLKAAAANMINVTAHEFNVTTYSGSGAYIKSLIQLSNNFDDVVHGTGIDAMIWLSKQTSGSVHWNTGLYFGHPDDTDAFPFDSNSTVFQFLAGTVNTLIDATQLTVTNAVLASPGFVLNGLGDISARGLSTSGAISGVSWTTTGRVFAIGATTATATTGSGTIATRVASSFGIPTFASSSATTLTRAANVYIDGPAAAGTNTTITNAYSLLVGSGTSLFGGNLFSEALIFATPTSGDATVGATAPTATDRAKFQMLVTGIGSWYLGADGSDSTKFKIAYNSSTFASPAVVITTANAITVGGTVSPIANDGAALGTTSLSWSDAFFASGAVLNFNNGNYTVTHSAGALTFSGAMTLSGALTYGGVTLSNSVTGTGAMVLATSPSLATPALGVATATSLAIGGATLGSNGLAVTGSATFSGALLPVSNDAAALGSATLSWSDLFVASGAVLNFANGNYTVTHSSALLTTSGAVTVGASLTVAASSAVVFSGRSQFQSPSDGVATLLNNAGSDFARLQFGGTTSSFPSLKRNTTILDCRLADDSNYAAFRCAGLTVNGVLTMGDTQNMAFNTSTGTKIGTGTTQKIGFWNATPVVQQARPTDAATIITLLTTLGLCA